MKVCKGYGKPEITIGITGLRENFGREKGLKILLGTLFFSELIRCFRNFTKKMELSVFELCGLRLRSHGTRRMSIKRGARVRVRVRFSVNPNPNPKTPFFKKKRKKKKKKTIGPKPGPDPNSAFY